MHGKTSRTVASVAAAAAVALVVLVLVVAPAAHADAAVRVCWQWPVGLVPMPSDGSVDEKGEKAQREAGGIKERSEALRGAVSGVAGA